MSDQGYNHSEEMNSPQGPLVQVLAEMVRSALEWEASQLESESDFSLNHDGTGIEYPPTDSQPVPVA